MADIELVIKVPEELLEYFVNHNCMSEDGWFSHSNKLLDAFRNATPLPKGHGNLIDVSEYFKKEFGDARKFLDEATTIIEADKESEDE